MLSGAGFGKSAALLTGLSVAIVFVTMTAIGRHIVDRVGRRRLTLVMVPGTVVSLIVLGIMFRMGMAETAQASGFWWPACSSTWSSMPAASGYRLADGIGDVSPSYSRQGEQRARGGALGLEPDHHLDRAEHGSLLGTGGAMWVYAGLNFLCFVFVWHFVPETTGHSLEDIENHLRAGKFMELRMKRAGEEGGIAWAQVYGAVLPKHEKITKTE